MVDIYGTLGPKCSDKDTLVQMFDAGMTGVRLNLSHITLHHAADQIETLHCAAACCGKKAQLLIDMQGPELRIGSLRAPLMLCENEEVQYYSKELPEEERQKIRRKGRAIPVPGVACDVLEKGMELLLDDGRFLLRITETADGGSRGMAMVVRGGMLSGDKSITVKINYRKHHPKYGKMMTIS
jgi:pyruvate kinase